MDMWIMSLCFRIATDSPLPFAITSAALTTTLATNSLDHLHPHRVNAKRLHAVMRTSHTVADACVELMIATCVERAGGCSGCE